MAILGIGVLLALGVRTLAAAMVQFGSTVVHGTSYPTLGQEFFGGIPFAEPPVNELRLRPPVPLFALNGASFDATQFKPGCIQPLKTATSVYSEDCLHLNIIRPSGLQPYANLPVMVWLYGGAFKTGDSSTINGSVIVTQSVARGTPVIYVNFNYRIGPLGFPQGTEAEAAGILNLGLKDQIVALEWLQTNIHLFGGDKTKVTVFGESAGAMSIAIHMLRPEFSSLAHALILESGSAGTFIPNVPTTPKKEFNWAGFVASVPACAAHAGSTQTLDCLRRAPLSATTLVNATDAALLHGQEHRPFTPVLDGPRGVFPALASAVLPTGAWAQLPFILGANLDEGTSFVPNPGANRTDADIRSALRANFTPPVPPLGAAAGGAQLDAAIDRLFELYPDKPALGSPFGTGNETFGLPTAYKRVSAMNLWFHAPRRELAMAAAALNLTAYAYLFADPQPADVSAPRLGVPHGADVAYVYGDCATRTSATQELCTNIIDYWVSFAVSQNPNDGKGGTRPAWNTYTAPGQELLYLHSANVTMVTDTYREEQLAFIMNHAILFHH